MLIRHFQSVDLITFRETQSCREVLDALVRWKIRRALIVRDGELLGMVTDRDLLRVLNHSVSDLSSREGQLADARPIRSIMQRKLLTVSPTDHLEDAARIMHEHKIGGLPVLSHGALVGIVTESDIFRAFVGATGDENGLRVTIDLEPRRRESRLDPIDLVRGLDLKLLGFTRYSGPGGREMAALRVSGERIAELRTTLVGAGWPMIEQRRDGLRESA